MSVSDISPYGSSPLTRGKPRGHRRDAKPRRLIPAHAGKTARRHCAHRRRPAHPRSRGENGVAGCICHAPIGSSPLTRGKRATQVIAGPTMRLIPAHAGKTSSVTRPRVASAAHPRSRGENMVSDGKVSLEDGSSPLTRGKLRGDSLSSAMIGLIPAHAGKTVQPATTAQIDAAHPRSRGENLLLAVHKVGSEGSSPLTRGKLSRLSCPSRRRAAHPRSRGENPDRSSKLRYERGSSPLTRGKPPAGEDGGCSPGLIPAHAGKTLRMTP